MLDAVVGALVGVGDLEELGDVRLPALIRRVLGELAAHGPVILHLEQMEQVAAVAPDPPGAHPGATQRRVEVVRDLAVLAYVVGLSALGDAGVQGDGLHRSHSWMSMAVVLADPGPVGEIGGCYVSGASCV